jgi:hypothetical protein
MASVAILGGCNQNGVCCYSRAVAFEVISKMASVAILVMLPPKWPMLLFKICCQQSDLCCFSKRATTWQNWWDMHYGGKQVGNTAGRVLTGK